jgi:hypothetical protein
MIYVLKTSFGRDSLGSSGDPNKVFLVFLFSHHASGVHFLKDAEIIRDKVLCNSCGHEMSCYSYPNVLDAFRWRWRRMVSGTRRFTNMRAHTRQLFPHLPLFPWSLISVSRRYSTITIAAIFGQRFSSPSSFVFDELVLITPEILLPWFLHQIVVYRSKVKHIVHFQDRCTNCIYSKNLNCKNNILCLINQT